MRAPLHGLLLTSLVLFAACEPEPEPEPEDTGTVDTVVTYEPLTIDFRAEVDGQPFACDTEFRYLGVNSSNSLEFQDFRMFVSNIGLVDSTGETTLLELTSSEWQNGPVALLDFEDGTWNCEGNTPETNTQIIGEIPEGEYTGLAFTIGVPFGQNHTLVTDTTPAPFNAPGMFRGKLPGYYFFKVDTTSLGQPDGFPLHVHSSGCTAGPNGEVEGCLSDNRITYVLEAFDPDTQTVVIDLALLVERLNLDLNATSGPPNEIPTPAGCQSDVTDQDCRDLFISYGAGALPPTYIYAD